MNKNNKEVFNSLDYYEKNIDEQLALNDALFNDPYCILISKRINEKNRKKIKARISA